MNHIPYKTIQSVCTKQRTQARTYGFVFDGIYEEDNLYYVKWNVTTGGHCGIRTSFYHNVKWELPIGRLIEVIYHCGACDTEKSVYEQIHRVLKLPKHED